MPRGGALPKEVGAENFNPAGWDNKETALWNIEHGESQFWKKSQIKKNS